MLNGPLTMLEDQVRSRKFQIASDFPTETFARHWLVTDVVANRQPVVIAGPKACLKTSLAVDLAVSLSSATQFLGHFTVPDPVSVAFVAESGAAAIVKEMADRICAARRIRLGGCSLTWLFRYPDLDTERGLELLEEKLFHARAKVVIIDPLQYGWMPIFPDAESRVAWLRGLLHKIERACLSAGATPIVIGQMTKPRHEQSRAAESRSWFDVDDFDNTGLIDFAKQWILVNRASPYCPHNCCHKLLMTVGGTIGHHGRYRVAVTEGRLNSDFSGRSWSVELQDGGPIDNTPITEDEVVGRPSKRNRGTRTR